VLFDHLAKAGRSTLPLRLGDDVPVAREHGRYPVVKLRGWLHQVARDLATRFDARNGTDYFQQQIQARAELHQWAVADATPDA
jgi:hypothetical protein